MTRLAALFAARCCGPARDGLRLRVDTGGSEVEEMT